MELLIIIFVLCLASLIAFVVKRRVVFEFVSVVSSAIVVVLSLIVALKVAASGEYNPFVFFSIDALGALLMLIISCVGFLVVVYSVQYLRQETARNIIGLSRVGQFYVLMNLFLAAMFLVVSTSSPVFAWISIEATTLSTAFLVSFYNKHSAMEAAWKYLIINSVGLLLGFFGTLLYFTSITGEPGFTTWHNLFASVSTLDPLIAKIAFIFVLIGYGTKVGLAPMHTWLPDAHSKAPVPISALLSGVLLNAALLVVLRFRVITDSVVDPAFSRSLLIIFGIISILVAALIIFTQKNYKRLLAYSSIENMGIIVLGFGFGGVGITAAILHMIYHALAKSALFLTAGNIFLKYGSTQISKVKGAIKVIPITSVVFLIGFFTIIGAPPLGIFFTKVLIFSAGLKAYPFFAVIAIFLAAILFVGFFKHISAMFFGEKPVEMEKEKENIWLIIPPLLLLVLVLCLSFYQPPFLRILISNAALNY